MGGEEVGRSREMEKWWLVWRSLANSTRGIRWPIPGLGTITMRGGGCGFELLIMDSKNKKKML